jgi:hypothetical protein
MVSNEVLLMRVKLANFAWFAINTRVDEQCKK